MRIASTSPPADAAACKATYQAVLGEVQAPGAQFVESVGHPCRAVAWRLWHFQGELLSYMRHPAVPADNNGAKRVLPPLVVARKISGRTRASRGTQTRTALMTLAATWAASGQDALAEFRRLLQAPLLQV